MGEMHRLDKQGDTRFTWDATKPDEVQAAQEVFATYQSQGYKPARMQGGKPGEFIQDFDPQAESIIFIPKMRAG